MQNVFVHGLNGKSVTIQVGYGGTVESLKASICKKTNVPVDRQRLLFPGSNFAVMMDEAVLPKGEMVNVQMVLVGGLAGGGGGQSKAKKGGKEKTFLDVGLKEEEYSGFDDDAPGDDGADWQKEKAALKKEMVKRDEKIAALSKEVTTLKKDATTLKKDNTTLKKDNATLKKGNTTLKKDNTSSKKENTTLQVQESSPGAEEFRAGKAAMQINIDKLGGVYTALGQHVADLRGLEAELAALKKDKETSAYPEAHQTDFIDPMEADIKAAKEEEEKFINDIIRMRNEFSEQAMPESKACAALYSSIFEDQSSGSEGAAALQTICSAVATLKDSLPPAPTDGTKASKQPDEPVHVLQREGVLEAKKMHGAAMAALHTAGMEEAELEGSSVCPTEKSAGRGFEKVYRRWGGDHRAVTDWGRATVCALTLVLLAKALATTLQTLTALGYTVVAVKNTFDSRTNCTANGEYRNLMLNLKCPESGHVVELQFNVSPIEAVKQTRGHTVFELLRRCGFSQKNSVVKGGWTSTMETAIRCGRAVELNCMQANWIAADVEKLANAFGAPGCRVSVMNGSYSTGDGAGAMAKAAVSCATMKDLK